MTNTKLSQCKHDAPIIYDGEFDERICENCGLIEVEVLKAKLDECELAASFQEEKDLEDFRERQRWSGNYG